MTFLDKFQLLKKSIPVPAINIYSNTEECEYADYLYESKNCYYCFDSISLKDSLYCMIAWGKNLTDCTAVTESELCYECVDCNNCYNSTYLLDCNNSRDCDFSAFLNSCSDCFGCVALTHKKYCFFNEQCTKEGYETKVKELKKGDPEEILKQMLELKKTIPHPASIQNNNENCAYGDYVYNSKNCYWCFHNYYSEDSGYSFESGIMKKCWDLYSAGGLDIQGVKSMSERCYEGFDIGSCYNCAFLTSSTNCTNCFYSSYLRNCSDCFGCVGLSGKKYCILNNQLTKEEYEKTVKIIKKELGWKSE